MEFSRTTILVAGLGLFDLVQGWDFIAQSMGFGFLAIPAAIASGMALLFTLWIIVHGVLKLTAIICAKIARAMENMVKSIVRKILDGIEAAAKAVVAWTKGKRK